MKRRGFLKQTALGVAAMGMGANAENNEAQDAAMAAREDKTYRYRIGFGAWINDMRNRALPLENWPAPQFDDETVAGAIRALDVMSEAGYEYLDAFGLWATGDYPLDVESAFRDVERRKRLKTLFNAAKKRKIRMVLPLGLFTWGYDRIIREDPEVCGQNADGTPHAHAMCGAKEKSWRYVERLIDAAFSEFDFAAVHMESADQGWCQCPQCAGKYGTVGYNARLNIRASQYIKGKHPGTVTYAIPINWAPWGLTNGEQTKFSEDEIAHVIELSRHIDVFMDQGHRGRFMPWDRVHELHCAYGTSGGLWTYHGARVDRLSYFLPYPMRAARLLREHYDHGARAGLIYQGPMINPAVEVNSAVSGRVMSDAGRDPREVLEEVIDAHYKPRRPGAARTLAELYVRAEEAYFGQWHEEAFRELHKMEMPGEFVLGLLFGTTPDPMTHLKEPFLNTEGRLACQKGLEGVLKDLAAIEDEFDDEGRIERMTRSIALSLHALNTIMDCKGEAWRS